MHIQTRSPAIFQIHCFPFPPTFSTNRIILIQYVSGNTSEIIFAQKGKQFRGILEPENNVIGVSKISITIEASLENIKMEFNIPPQIVEDSSNKRKINGKISMLWNWIAFV